MLSIKITSFAGAFLATLMIFSGCSANNSDIVTDKSYESVTQAVSVSETVSLAPQTEERISDTYEDTAEIEESVTGSEEVGVTEETAEAIPTVEETSVLTTEETAALPVSEDIEILTVTENTETEEIVEETQVTTKKTQKQKTDKSENKKDNKKKTEKKQETTVKAVSGVEKSGSYTSPEDVAEYIHTFGTLPNNFITKKELKKLGWSGGDVYKYADGKSIGGDHYGNYEGILPEGSYKECDVNYSGGKRGAERLVFSDDAIYYTNDHYNTFTQLY